MTSYNHLNKSQVVSDMFESASRYESNQTSNQKSFVVLFDVFAKTDFDLTVRKDEKIEITKFINTTWCEARNEFGKTGFIPINCVREYRGPQRSSTNDLHLSQKKKLIRSSTDTDLNLHKQILIRSVSNQDQTDPDESSPSVPRRSTSLKSKIKKDDVSETSDVTASSSDSRVSSEVKIKRTNSIPPKKPPQPRFNRRSLRKRTSNSQKRKIEKVKVFHLHLIFEIFKFLNKILLKVKFAF